jgi:hypothetical protein
MHQDGGSTTRSLELDFETPMTSPAPRRRMTVPGRWTVPLRKSTSSQATAGLTDPGACRREESAAADGETRRIWNAVRGTLRMEAGAVVEVLVQRNPSTLTRWKRPPGLTLAESASSVE